MATGARVLLWVLWGDANAPRRAPCCRAPLNTTAREEGSKGAPDLAGEAGSAVAQTGVLRGCRLGGVVALSWMSGGSKRRLPRGGHQSPGRAGGGRCHWEPPSSSLGRMTRPYSFYHLPTPHVSVTQGTADVGRQHVNPAIKVKVGGDVTWPTSQARMGRKSFDSPAKDARCKPHLGKHRTSPHRRASADPPAAARGGVLSARQTPGRLRVGRCRLTRTAERSV